MWLVGTVDRYDVESLEGTFTTGTSNSYLSLQSWCPFVVMSICSRWNGLRVRRWERVVFAVSQREQFGRVKKVIWHFRGADRRRREGRILVALLQA